MKGSSRAVQRARPAVLGRPVGGGDRVRAARAAAGALQRRRPGPGLGCPLPPDRRLVRRLRADRVAPPARQPQRPADDRDGLRVLHHAAAAQLDAPAAQTAGDAAVGGLRVRAGRADPDARDRRAVHVARRAAAGGGVRARRCWSGSSSGCCSTSDDGNVLGVFAERRTSPRSLDKVQRSLTFCACVATFAVVAAALAGGVAAAAAARCCRASPGRVALLLFALVLVNDLVTGSRSQRAAVGRDLLARHRAGGVPGRAAALAAGARRPGGAAARPADQAQRRAAGRAGEDARRPAARGRATGCPRATATSTSTASPSRCPSRAATGRWRRSSATAHEVAALVYDASLDDDPELVEAVRGRDRDRAGEPAACTRSPRRGWPSCGPRASASSRRATPSAGGSSATSTTARSSVWSRSRCSCACCSAGCAATRRRRAARHDRERRARPVARGAARAGARHPPRDPRARPRGRAGLARHALARPDDGGRTRRRSRCRPTSSSRRTSSPPRRWPTSPSTREANGRSHARVGHRRRRATSRSPTTASAAPIPASGSGLRGLTRPRRGPRRPPARSPAPAGWARP